MPRKNSKEDRSAIAILPILNEDVSLQLLLKRVQKPDNKRDDRSPEQKIIALKILILNMMQWTLTARQCFVNRRTLHKWWNLYGDLIKKTEPEKDLIKNITTDVAVAQGESLKEWYELLDKSAKKLGLLVDSATGTRSIYAIVEAVKASTEVIKLNKELSDSGKVQGADFFMGIHNLMIQNIYGNED